MLTNLSSRNELVFSELYDQFAHVLYGMIVQEVGNNLNADRILTIAFAKIWQHSDTYDEDKIPIFIWVMQKTRQAIMEFKDAGIVELSGCSVCT